MVHPQLSAMLKKEMSRKEFLVTAGFGVASLLGMSALLRMLGKENPWSVKEASVYGGSSYGNRTR